MHLNLLHWNEIHGFGFGFGFEKPKNYHQIAIYITLFFFQFPLISLITPFKSFTDSSRSNYQYKPRSELTNEIFKYFERLDESQQQFEPFPGTSTSQLSALCCICGEQRRYMKGNVSNLKTHLKRVNAINETF